MAIVGFWCAKPFLLIKQGVLQAVFSSHEKDFSEPQESRKQICLSKSAGGSTWAIAVRRGSYKSPFLLNSCRFYLEKKGNSALNFCSLKNPKIAMAQIPSPLTESNKSPSSKPLLNRIGSVFALPTVSNRHHIQYIEDHPHPNKKRFIWRKLGVRMP